MKRTSTPPPASITGGSGYGPSGSAGRSALVNSYDGISQNLQQQSAGSNLPQRILMSPTHQTAKSPLPLASTCALRPLLLLLFYEFVYLLFSKKFDYKPMAPFKVALNVAEISAL